MRSLTSIGLGLSLTFACLLLALVAEIYYLLWWKRRSWNSGITQHADCCTTTTTTITTTQSLTVTHRLHQPQNQNSHKNDLQLLKFDTEAETEDGSLQFHPMPGPQRPLCTIKEETREDMESEEGSFNGSMLPETPYLTPLASPSLLSSQFSSPYTHLGFNPLFESSTDAEVSRLKTSPPPTFKFLQEAEAKFQRRRMMMAEKDTDKDHFNNEGQHPERSKKVERDESFITIIVAQGGSRGHRG